MDAQEMHDLEMQNKPKLNLKGSSPKLKALLTKRNGSSSEPLRSTELDPIAQAMRNHPQLTKETAMDMMDALGL